MTICLSSYRRFYKLNYMSYTIINRHFRSLSFNERKYKDQTSKTFMQIEWAYVVNLPN